MSSDWQEVSLAEIVSIKGGKRLPAGKNLQSTPSKHPYIRVRDVGQRSLLRDGVEYVPDDVFPSISRYIVREHDVVLSIVGTIGALSIVDSYYDAASLTENCVKLTGLDRHDALYLYYFLSSRLGQQEISRGTVGAVQSKLPIYNIEKIKVLWPQDKESRKKIAHILGGLDDKIDLNRHINQTIEAMAQAIFQSWFVDFDPVKAKIAAKAEGRDPLRAAMSAICGKADAELDALPPEQYEQLAATAALFPDELEVSALGEIPKGWCFRSAEALAEVGIGKTPPRKEPQWFTEEEGDWRWVSIKDMGASGVFQQRSSEFLTADAVSRFNVRVVPDRTVLLSFKLTIGRVAITDGPMVTNEAIAHFKLPSSAAISSEYLYLYLKVFDYSTLGSTSSIADAVNSKTIREMPITVASGDIIDRFTKSVAPLFEEMRNRQNEIALLGATRDVLLPKLLSGEIEVPV